MRHFLFEEKEYRYKPYFKRRRNEQDSAMALAKLLRRFGASKTKRAYGSSSGGGGSGGRRRPADYRQNCTVKMHYSDSVDAHRFQLENYLVKEGKAIDGGRPELYGTEIEEYRERMVARNFRIFLSPQSDKIDLTRLANDFVKKLEQQTGFSLYWQAANHYDTAHPHAHLLINGVDKNGKEVEIPRDIVKTFMREYAQDICTAQIGFRTREDIALEKEKEPEAQRYTRLDNSLKDICFNNRVNPKLIYKDRERLLARLENLRKMNLCIFRDGAYELSTSWEEDLRANGRYNTFLKARSELKYTEQMNLKVYGGEAGIINGKVTKVYRTDGDASDNHAVIIEGLDGKAYFVPLFKEPVMYDNAVKTNEGKPAKFALKEGEFVSLKPLQNQKGRLTPFFFKRDPSQVRREIQRNNLTGTLAEAVKSENLKTKNVVNKQ